MDTNNPDHLGPRGWKSRPMRRRSRPRVSAREAALYNRAPSNESERGQIQSRGFRQQRRTRSQRPPGRERPRNDWYGHEHSPVLYPPNPNNADNQYEVRDGRGRRQPPRENNPGMRNNDRQRALKEIDRKLVRMSGRENECHPRSGAPRWAESSTVEYESTDSTYKHGYTGIPNHQQYRQNRGEEYTYQESPTSNRFDVLQPDLEWYN